MANLFCGCMVIKLAFKVVQLEKELKKIFNEEGISRDEIARFLVGTVILLVGKSVEIVPGFTATVKLSIEPSAHDVKSKDGAETNYVKMSPDGILKVNIITVNNTGDGLVSIALDFLDTEIDTEKYFSRDLITHGRFPRFNLDKQLSFDSTSVPPVNEVKF